jgi:hypothetical protein
MNPVGHDDGTTVAAPGVNPAYSVVVTGAVGVVVV